MSGELLKASLGLIVTPEPDLKVLLLRRLKNKDQNLIGKWQLPGGVQEPGETPEAAFEREMLEETGLSGLEVKDKLVVLQLCNNSPTYQFLIYFCTLNSGHNQSLRLGDDESDELRAFSRGDISELDLFPVTRAVLEHFGLV